MTIKKNSNDKNYPYTIFGAWGGTIYASEKDLQELQKEIKKALAKSPKV